MSANSKLSTGKIVGAVLSLALLSATVYVISWSWKKGQAVKASA